MSRVNVESVLKQVEALLARAGVLPVAAEEAVEKLLNVVEALTADNNELGKEEENKGVRRNSVRHDNSSMRELRVVAAVSRWFVVDASVNQADRVGMAATFVQFGVSKSHVDGKRNDVRTLENDIARMSEENKGVRRL